MNTILPSICKLTPLTERASRKLFGSALETRYYEKFFDTSSESAAPSGSRGRILVYSGISSMYLTPVEILLYHLLRRRGYEVDYLVYDETVGHNEVTTIDRHQNEGDRFWKRSTREGLRRLRAANVDFQLISIDPEATSIANSLSSDPSDIFSYELDGFPVGDIVKGVMYRYYKSISIGEDCAPVARSFLATTLTNYFEIKRRIERNEYHDILFSHGIYCTWQIVSEFLESKNIGYACYDRGKTKGCININRSQPSPVWDIAESWERLADYQLSAAEDSRVDNYLKERETQKGDVYAYNFSEKTSNLEALRGKLGISKDSTVITVFTNLIWDAANVSRDIAFDSPLDCINQLVERYGNQPDIHLLVRCHPAEKVLGTHERYGQLVRESQQQSLPPNLSIIEPEMDINSFDILDISDIGVVHTSTVGLEMAIEAKPVILISETHYRGKGFTYDVNNRNEFFETIDLLSNSKAIKPNQVQLARKYFFLMMFEYQHLAPMQFTQNNAFDGYGYDNLEHLASDDKAAINQIIGAIEEKRSDFVFR